MSEEGKGQKGWWLLIVETFFRKPIHFFIVTLIASLAIWLTLVFIVIPVTLWKANDWGLEGFEMNNGTFKFMIPIKKGAVTQIPVFADQVDPLPIKLTPGAKYRITATGTVFTGGSWIDLTKNKEGVDTPVRSYYENFCNGEAEIIDDPINQILFADKLERELDVCRRDPLGKPLLFCRSPTVKKDELQNEHKLLPGQDYGSLLAVFYSTDKIDDIPNFDSKVERERFVRLVGHELMFTVKKDHTIIFDKMRGKKISAFKGASDIKMALLVNEPLLTKSFIISLKEKLESEMKHQREDEKSKTKAAILYRDIEMNIFDKLMKERNGDEELKRLRWLWYHNNRGRFWVTVKMEKYSTLFERE